MTGPCWHLAAFVAVQKKIIKNLPWSRAKQRAGLVSSGAPCVETSCKGSHSVVLHQISAVLLYLKQTLLYLMPKCASHRALLIIVGFSHTLLVGHTHTPTMPCYMSVLYLRENIDTPRKIFCQHMVGTLTWACGQYRWTISCRNFNTDGLLPFLDPHHYQIWSVSSCFNDN